MAAVGTLAASRAMLIRLDQSSCCAKAGVPRAFFSTSYRDPLAQNSVTMQGGSRHRPMNITTFGCRRAAMIDTCRSKRYEARAQNSVTMQGGSRHRSMNITRFGCRRAALMDTCRSRHSQYYFGSETSSLHWKFKFRHVRGSENAFVHCRDVQGMRHEQVRQHCCSETTGQLAHCAGNASKHLSHKEPQYTFQRQRRQLNEKTSYAGLARKTSWMYTRSLQHRIGEQTGEQMGPGTAFNYKDGHTKSVT